MTAKHRDPEYSRNARIIRQRVAGIRRAGGEVRCWRCGWPIDEEQRWDVGHIDRDGGHGLDNLAPEHRYKTTRCIGNRADGGRIGAARRQTTRPKPKPSASITTTGILPW